MNTTEEHYQDWLETYVAQVMWGNKTSTNFGRDACPGKIYVLKFHISAACAKKTLKKSKILCCNNYFYLRYLVSNVTNITDIS